MTCKRPWFVWCINVNNWLCCNDCVKFNDASVCNVRKLHFQVSFCRQHEVKRQYWFYCSRSFDQLLWTRCLSAPTQLGGADKHLFEANLSFLKFSAEESNDLFRLFFSREIPNASCYTMSRGHKSKSRNSTVQNHSSRKRMSRDDSLPCYWLSFPVSNDVTRPDHCDERLRAWWTSGRKMFFLFYLRFRFLFLYETLVSTPSVRINKSGN